MSWFQAVPSLAVALAVLIIPGAAVASLLRLRGLALLGASAPISISLIAVAALISPWIGLTWSPWVVIGLTLAACLAAVAWSRWVGRPKGTHSTPAGRRFATAWPLVIAVVTPAVVIGFTLIRSMGQPDYLSQRYDNFFHLNAVQYVLDTGNASPLWLGTMTSGDTGGLPFYPSAWHALVALVVDLSGASVVVSTNAVVIVVAAVVWPVGAVLLTRTLLGRGRAVVIAAGVLAAAFPAFPYLPLHYGVLYPLFLGLAALPAALAFASLALRPGTVRRRQDLVLLVLLMIPGLGVAHPGALLALLALTLPAMIALLAHAIVHARSGTFRVVWIGVLLGYLGAGILALWVVRPPANQIYWGVIATLPHAVGEVVTASVYQYPVAPAVAALLAIGAYSCLRRPTWRRWVILGTAVIGSLLYIIVAGSPFEILRTWLTGPWYNNAPRLASIWVVAVLPLAALGASTFVRFVLGRLPALRRRIDAHRLLGAVIATIVLLLATQGVAIRQAAADLEFTYDLRPGGPILTPDEFALIMRLPELVPADAVIAADPWTGASFAYGMSDRRVLMPHLLMEESDAAHVVNTRLSTAGDSPAVCAALEETGVRYVLDFSSDGDFMDNDGDFSGLDGLAVSPYVEPIAEQGDAVLYRITSCGLSS
ncbi:DUF6541 family protein [Microbacterium sp. NPDC064584]|uniref:DUF6541 family protein n=1 Tax=Microbacterium sp. NPDC064584 TaxID=3155817 RepID=UPI0034399117